MNKRLKLIEEITQRSESKDWANAKNEWSFLHIYYSDETNNVYVHSKYIISV